MTRSLDTAKLYTGHTTEAAGYLTYANKKLWMKGLGYKQRARFAA